MEKSDKKVYLCKKKGIFSFSIIIFYLNIILSFISAHKDSIISIALNSKDESHNIIATSSDDNSVRIWDLRMNSSVKYFSLAKEKEGDVGNVIFNENNEILVSKGKKV